MTSTIVLLLLSAGIIYVSCEYFVNGVEWVGRRFGVGQSAVGTVLAAFGTALPESVVTFVAVVFGDTGAQKEIGVGAALGGPLVLGTIAYAVVGIVFLIGKAKQHRTLLDGVNTKKLSRDQAWFMGIFIAKVSLGLVAFAVKPWLGVIFVVAYAIYVWEEMRRPEDRRTEEEALQPLKFRPRTRQPSTAWAVFQTVTALFIIFMSSRLFVHQLDAIGPWLGISPQMVALLLSPVATELPEILNAVIWVRQGKVALALSNISGAMMIQATIPSALGIFFTPWILSRPLIWAAVVTMIAITMLFILLVQNGLTPTRLALLALFYGLFAAGLFASPAHGLEPANIDGPDFVESSEVAPKGMFGKRLSAPNACWAMWHWMSLTESRRPTSLIRRN
jgi:cation:H+ antiporter